MAAMERRAALAMVMATLLWGATFVAIRGVLADLPPVPLVCGRFAAAALLYALVLGARRTFPTRETLAVGALSGALAAGGFLFQAIGLTETSAGSSAFLTCGGTLFAAVFAWPLLGQRPDRMLAIGLVLALAGAALLSLTEGLGVGRGEAWTLVGALLFALQVVALGRFAPRLDPIALTAVQCLTIAVVTAPFARGAPALFAALPPSAWRRFAYLALAGSTLAPLLQVWAQRVLPPGRVGLMFALEPVFAVMFAVWLAAERFGARWWLGSLLILAAVALVEGSARPRPASRSATA